MILKNTTLFVASFSLLVMFLFVSCKKELSLEKAQKSGGTAQFSFDGGTGSCTGATVSGNFTAGTPATAANTVEISVTVDSIGSYIIATNTVNGISFSGSGVFTDKGAQTITLTATGTPTTAGTFPFPLGSNGCTFLVSVVSGGNPGGGGSGGSGSGNFLRCKINGVLTNFNTGLTGYIVTPPSADIPYSLTVRGNRSGVANSKEELWVVASNPTPPTTGIYSNGTFSSGTTDRLSKVSLFPTGFPNPFWSSSVMSANTFTVDVTSVSTSGATGTFQGTIYEANGLGPATKNVTEGEFKVTF